MVKTFEKILSIVLQNEEMQRLTDTRFEGTYLVDMAHRMMAGSPSVSHPLTTSLRVGPRWERWEMFKLMLDIQLDQCPVYFPTADIRRVSGHSSTDFPICLHPFVREYWGLVECNYSDLMLLPDPYAFYRFYRNIVLVDVGFGGLDGPLEFFGDIDVSSGVHYWEIQLLCPSQVVPTYRDRCRVGVAVKENAGWRTYCLSNNGLIVLGHPSGSGDIHSPFSRDIHSPFSPPLCVGDRVGILYDGVTDALYFTINGVGHGAAFCCLLGNRCGMVLRLVDHIRPYFRVAWGSLSFSLSNQRTYAASLKSLSLAAVMSCLIQAGCVDSIVSRINRLPLSRSLKDDLRDQIPCNLQG